MSEFSVERRLILRQEGTEYGIQQCPDMPEIVELTTNFFGNDKKPEVVISMERDMARAFASLILEYCENDENFKVY
jgi:hypothetical protein